MKRTQEFSGEYARVAALWFLYADKRCVTWGGFRRGPRIYVKLPATILQLGELCKPIVRESKSGYRLYSKISDCAKEGPAVVVSSLVDDNADCTMLGYVLLPGHGRLSPNLFVFRRQHRLPRQLLRLRTFVLAQDLPDAANIRVAMKGAGVFRSPMITNIPASRGKAYGEQLTKIAVA